MDTPKTEKPLKSKSWPPCGAPTVGAILSKPIMPPEYLLSPWLERGSQVLLWGPSGQGKSLITMTIASLVAGGGQALGWTATEPSRVLYIDGEMGERQVQRRLPQLVEGVVGFNEKAWKRNLAVLTPDTQGFQDAPWDLADEKQHPRILESIEGRHVRLVVLDNLSTLSASLLEENEAASVKPLQKLLRSIKERGAAVILVHHANKNGSSFRGSSNLLTTFEREITVRRAEDAEPSAAKFVVEFGKYRDAPEENHTGRGTWGLIKGRGWVRSDEETGEPPLWKEFREGAHKTLKEFCENHDIPYKHFEERTVRRWKRHGVKADQIEKAKEEMRKRKKKQRRSIEVEG